MKLNARLSIKQKIILFFNRSGAEQSVFVFLFSLILSLAVISKIDLKYQNGNIILLFLLLVFPAIGFYLMYKNFREFPRIIYALENGVCIEGEIIRIASTNIRVNKKPLKEIRISYELYGEKYTLVEEMTIPVSHLEKHLIMVDADDPSNAVYFETLPFDVKKELMRKNQYI